MWFMAALLMSLWCTLRRTGQQAASVAPHGNETSFSGSFFSMELSFKKTMLPAAEPTVHAADGQAGAGRTMSVEAVGAQAGNSHSKLIQSVCHRRRLLHDCEPQTPLACWTFPSESEKWHDGCVCGTECATSLETQCSLRMRTLNHGSLSPLKQTTFSILAYSLSL